MATEQEPTVSQLRLTAVKSILFHKVRRSLGLCPVSPAGPGRKLNQGLMKAHLIPPFRP